MIHGNYTKISKPLSHDEHKCVHPDSTELKGVLEKVGISTDLATIGVDRHTAMMTFKSTKDIRDKYVLSGLAWDLGILDDLCELL